MPEDQSPLTSSHLHDKHGSRRPWSSYRKVFDKASGVTYRVPQSKLCSLCRNVWKLLGFSHKYGNIAKYVKMIAEKRVDHAVFLASLDEWIKKHNANPNKHRLRNADDKDSVRDAKEKLVTKDEHGCEFEAPDMFFVEVDNWKPEYGPLEEAKIVEKKIFCKVRRGAYVQTGQTGHFKVKDFERTVVSHQTEEHDGEQDLFNAEAMANKKEAVSNAMQEARRERTSKAVAAEVPFNLDSVLAMLHQHGAVGAGEASSRAAGGETGATGNPQEQPADPSDNVEDEGFGDEDEGVASRLASLGGKKMASLAKTGSRAVAKPAAKVLAKAVPKTTQAVPKTTPAVPAGTVQPAAPMPKPSPSAKPSNQGSQQEDEVPEEQVTASLDGRDMRLQESLQKAFRKADDELDALLAFTDAYNWKEKKDFKARQKQLNAAVKACQNNVKRVDASSNRAAFAEVKGDFETMQADAEQAIALNTELASTNPNSTALMSCYGYLETHRPAGFFVDPSLLVHHVEQHMQFAQNHRVRWGQAVPAKLAANQWYQTLGDREQDALSLLQQCTPYIVFRDLSQSIVRGNSNTWRQDPSKHVMSTVLPRMVLWCEAQNRLVLGREALLMQGFPVQPFLQILAARMETMPLAQQWHPSEALVMDLAGNAMALPVVLAMVQCALTALNWKDRTLSGQAVQLALSQTEDSCWNVC